MSWYEIAARGMLPGQAIGGQREGSRPRLQAAHWARAGGGSVSAKHDPSLKPLTMPHLWLTMKITPMCLLVSHMAQFDHNISIRFTNICEATSGFTQSPREYPCAKTPNPLQQLILEYPGPPPILTWPPLHWSWVGPRALSHARLKTDTELPVWVERPKFSTAEGKKTPLLLTDPCVF